MPGVPPDALAQVKRGLRSLFSRRKKKQQPTQQPTQPEATPTSNGLPDQTTTAPAPAPVEAPTTSQRSITEVDNAPESEDHPHPPSHPAADPTTTTAASLMPDPPPLTQTAPVSADHLNTFQRHPHISAPSQIEEAKEIDLNPMRDIKTEASDIKTEAPSQIKPRTETGMSATSGPMGDHMAEVWRDSDVGAKEERPVDLESKAVGIPEGAVAEGDGGKF